MKRFLHSGVMFSHAVRLRQLDFRIDATISIPLSVISAKEKAHHRWTVTCIELWRLPNRAPKYR